MIIRLLFGRRLPPADTSGLKQALTGLQHLLPEPNPNLKGKSMTQPVVVQIAQADLDNFAAGFEAVKAALVAYIAQLQANQPAPLPEADENGLKQALADLQALEPPAPAPAPAPSS